MKERTWGQFEFENKQRIFLDVDRSYKYALLIWDKDQLFQPFPPPYTFRMSWPRRSSPSSIEKIHC